MTYALSQGEEMGKDLQNPVPVQCVLFNGVNLEFVCFQLNSLDFNDENQGIKNIAWVVGDERLYDQVTEEDGSESEDFIEYTSTRVSLVDFNRKLLTETFSDEKTIKVSVDDYNRNAIDAFINLLLRR